MNSLYYTLGLLGMEFVLTKSGTEKDGTEKVISDA